MAPQTRQTIVWLGALVAGGIIGLAGVDGIDALIDFVATVYTRLFQLLAVPTIALAIMTTLASLGTQSDVGRIFRRTIFYTLLTTFAAAFVGLGLYAIIAPENLPQETIAHGTTDVPASLGELSYYDHILQVIPNNLLKPFIEGNVLSILILSATIGIAVAKMKEGERKQQILSLTLGLQDILYTLIRGLIWALPLGIAAYAAQLTREVTAGVIVNSLGKYVAVVIGGNLIQFFVILPVFLLLRRLNPLKIISKMAPAIMMALFTKSSAATLPVTMQSAEERLGVSPKVSRFVLPICTTINMNGCASFILVTSLFILQNGGVALTWQTMLLWVFIAVISAVGNAGVPMGCYFLTLSLMSQNAMPVGIMGIILPIYTIIDMIETAENVWSDSCVNAMVAHDVEQTRSQPLAYEKSSTSLYRLAEP